MSGHTDTDDSTDTEQHKTHMVSAVAWVLGLLAPMQTEYPSEWVKCWATSGWFSCWEGVYYIAAPQSAVVMFVGGAGAIALFSWTESLTLTATWATLVSGVLISMAPTPMAGTIAILVTVLVGAAYFAVHRSRL